MRPDGSVVYRPVLPVLVRGPKGWLPRYFLVDSGADYSMAPHELCRQLGLRWRDGASVTLRGISQRKTCAVQGRIHQVEVLLPKAALLLQLPMVFAKGNAPFVLGQEGFFEAFNITFERTKRKTVFQLI